MNKAVVDAITDEYWDLWTLQQDYQPYADEVENMADMNSELFPAFNPDVARAEKPASADWAS